MLLETVGGLVLFLPAALPLEKKDLPCGEKRYIDAFRSLWNDGGYGRRVPGHGRSPEKKGVMSVPGVFLNEDDYNFDIALRRFKKQVEKAGVLSEMKKRQHYEKPSVMRKKKKAAARKRLMKKMRKMNAA